MTYFNTIDVEMSDKSYTIKYNACKILSFDDNDLINVMTRSFKNKTNYVGINKKHKIAPCDNFLN